LKDLKLLSVVFRSLSVQNAVNHAIASTWSSLVVGDVSCEEAQARRTEEAASFHPAAQKICALLDAMSSEDIIARHEHLGTVFASFALIFRSSSVQAAINAAIGTAADLLAAAEAACDARNISQSAATAAEAAAAAADTIASPPPPGISLSATGVPIRPPDIAAAILTKEGYDKDALAKCFFNRSPKHKAYVVVFLAVAVFPFVFGSHKQDAGAAAASSSSLVANGYLSNCTVTANATVVTVITRDCTTKKRYNDVVTCGERYPKYRVNAPVSYTPLAGGAGAAAVSGDLIHPGVKWRVYQYTKTFPASTRNMLNGLAAVNGTLACWFDPTAPAQVNGASFTPHARLLPVLYILTQAHGRLELNPPCRTGIYDTGQHRCRDC
jgi:hypothetical protein